jgi:hypothetical protein
MKINRTRNRLIAFMLFLLPMILFIALERPAEAIKIEWRDDGLYIIDGTSEYLFQPVGDISTDPWTPRVASLSPDGEWVAFLRHTGGGFEDEGQSCFAAKWNGEDERLVYESDYIIPAIYWLETRDSMYVVCQMQSGGTLYHSHFAVTEFETGNLVTKVEGMIYGVSHGGTRFQPYEWWVPTGLRYEILGMDEEPSGWGVYYVDELMQFIVSPNFTNVDRVPAEDCPLTDGMSSTAWLGESAEQPSTSIGITGGTALSGLGIYSGWQWHAPPAPDGLPWEGRDLFREYDRPAEIKVYFDDGSSMDFTLEDKRAIQYVYFEDFVNTASVTIKVMSVYDGLVDHHVAISEIFLF